MFVRSVKEWLYCVYKWFAVIFFNLKYHTSICSVHASLGASYGGKNGIEKGTFVAPDVTMGYMTYVNRNSWLENCDLGNYCSISSNVLIGPAEHNIDRILSHPVAGCRKTKRVYIGHDVLISHGVTVLQGITIGDGAVIAAGAVVTKDVEPYTVVGGVPARFIKIRFGEEMVSKIRALELYDKSEEEIKEILRKCSLEEDL